MHKVKQYIQSKAGRITIISAIIIIAAVIIVIGLSSSKQQKQTTDQNNQVQELQKSYDFVITDPEPNLYLSDYKPNTPITCVPIDDISQYNIMVSNNTGSDVLVTIVDEDKDESQYTLLSNTIDFNTRDALHEALFYDGMHRIGVFYHKVSTTQDILLAEPDAIVFTDDLQDGVMMPIKVGQYVYNNSEHTIGLLFNDTVSELEYDMEMIPGLSFHLGGENDKMMKCFVMD